MVGAASKGLHSIYFDYPHHRHFPGCDRHRLHDCRIEEYPIYVLIDTILTWRHWRSEKKHQPVSRGLHLYTRFAYLWWVLAYLAGGLIAAIGLG
jgi:hypothetical protein